MPQSSKSRIPKSFIDDLLVRTDIVEIIGNRIQLRKTGNNFTALCPFHNEKTPSFTVSHSKQFYYCFGCGAHGNAISFIMNFDRMEFIDAIETLASYIGLDVPQEISKDSNFAPEFHQILTKSNQYYQQQLCNANNAITYLKTRGLSGEICKRFNIGYAPPGWNNLLAKLGKTSDLQSQLINTGMLVKKDDHLYDRFRDRIMFPIRNQRGNIIGFGGRSLGNETPKYLNSPETPIFNKSQELYGLYEAKHANNNLSYIIIVEGYMDVISLAQHEITCAVATLGTATTIKHIQKLLRYTSKIVFCFDGDTAGEKAAWRALQNTLPLMRDGIQASFLFLPENEDPDSQIRKESKSNFLKRIHNSIPLSEFFFTQLIEEEAININTADGRAHMAQKANQLLDTIPNGIFYQLMLKKLAEKIHLDPTELRNFSKMTKASPTYKHNITKSPSLILSALKLLLHYPQLAKYAVDLDQIANIDLPYMQLLIQLLTLLKQHPNFTTANILEHWRDKKETQLLAKLTASEIPIAAQNLQNEFTDTIKRLREHSNEQTIQKLLQETNNGNISPNDKYRLQKLITDAKIKH
jgi:DNA primase